MHLHRFYSILMIILGLTAVLAGGFAAQARPASTQPEAAYRVTLPLVVQPKTGAGLERRAPNPVRIAVTPDTPPAADAEIGAEGGSLAASAADGTTFNLVIPPGALEYTHTITLIPLHITDLPFAAGSRGALLIEPAGLTLLKPAILTISPASGGNEGLSAYAFEPDGAEFHLYPVMDTPAEASTGSATIQTLRGYGVTHPTHAELSAHTQRTPTRFVDWLEQQAALHPSTPLDIESKTFQEYIDTELKPAMSDPSRAERAFTEAVRIDKLVFQYGDPISMGYWSLIVAPEFQRLLDAAAAGAHQRCVANQRPSEGLRIARFIRYVRSINPEADVTALQSRLGRCLTFEVTFTSTLIEQSPVFTRRVSMQAGALLTVEGVTPHLIGNGRAQVTATSWEGEQPCGTYTTSLGASDFLASAAPNGLRLSPSSAEFTYAFGSGIQALYQFRCPTPGGTVNIDTALPWDAYYDLLHLEDRVTISMLSYRTNAQAINIDQFTGWVYNDTQNLGEVTLTEDTQIELTHRPQQ